MATNSEPLRLSAGVLFAADRVSSRALMFRNVCFGLLDYTVQPLLMLVTARFFVRHLGIAQFGVWMLVLAVIGSSGTLCTGFGDAALKYVSMMRGRGDYAGVFQVLESSFVLNFNLGLLVATVLYAFSPWASLNVFHLPTGIAAVMSSALRVGAFVLIVRSCSFVFISALRAFENYRASTRITALTRIAIITIALLFVRQGHGIVAIMVGTLLCELLSIVALVFSLRAILPLHSRGDRRPFSRNLVSFGTYSWLQALSGTIFSQADRLLVAAMLGPAALAYYGICIQAAQPIHGLAAAGSNVLFPHLSAKIETEGKASVAVALRKSVQLNLGCVLVLACPLLLMGGPILHRWMGADFATHASRTLALVALSFVFLAANIPAHYALMALSKVRYLTGLNLIGAFVSLLVAFILVPHLGIVGAAIGRLCYGPVTWVAYPRLNSLLHSRETLRAS